MAIDDLRREKAYIQNPNLATAKQKKVTQGLSTDAMRQEQIKRNQQAKASPTPSRTITPATPVYTPPTPQKPSGGIIPTTNNSIYHPTQPTQPTPILSQAPAQPAQAPAGDPDIQQMIKDMHDAKMSETLPHFHKDLVQMEDDELEETIL